MSTHTAYCAVCGDPTYCTSDAHALGSGRDSSCNDSPVAIEFCSAACFEELEATMRERREVIFENDLDIKAKLHWVGTVVKVEATAPVYVNGKPALALRCSGVADTRERCWRVEGHEGDHMTVAQEAARRLREEPWRFSEPSVSQAPRAAWMDESFRIKKLPESGRNGI